MRFLAGLRTHRSGSAPAQLLALSLLVIVVGGLAAGCGGGSTKVTPEEQRALPTVEYVASQELCVSGVRDRERRRAILRRGRRHLAAIVASHRRNPAATVETTYPTDTSLLDSGGEKTERLTVTELAAQWLRSLRYANCSPASQRRLQALDGVAERSRRPVP